jgi:polyphosphate kinase
MAKPRPRPAGNGGATAPPEPPERRLFFSRELSWLDFNDRVLQLAESEDLPLLERVKFCAIYAQNLDEFFMVRVARLRDKVAQHISAVEPEQSSPEEILERIHERVQGLVERHTRLFAKVLRPALRARGLCLVSLPELAEAQREALRARFREQIFPTLTPLALGFGRPFPYISNLSLSLAVLLRDPVTDSEVVARVKVPKELLPRFLQLKGTTTFVPLEDVISHHLESLFPGMQVQDVGYFRVTRDTDYTVSEDAEDLLRAVEVKLRQRRFGEVLRLELSTGLNPRLRDALVEALEVEASEIYEVDGLLDLADLHSVVSVQGFAELRDPPWQPVTQVRLFGEEGQPSGVMAAMRRGDLLVHHPYDSFATSVERFVNEAVDDPDVLAIKQTVYRTSDSSPLVPALIRAAERGKQSVCMVELKARFDELTNIAWARRLEEAGVHVVYGIPGMKTHAKAILVVRREGEGVRHYVHIGTGNYNPKTARLYTDMGLFTTDPEIGADVADLFNFLTGFARPKAFRKLLVAPMALREQLLEEVARTIEAHRKDSSSRIRMKMNALVDPALIRALYEASSAGVPVELNIRGICCLRPGVPGLSERICVVSTLGRFLEHSRVYLFESAGKERLLIGSADLMPRNLDDRVEALVPIEDPVLRSEAREVLDRCLADNTAAWELQPDGSWKRRKPGAADKRRSAQAELMQRAATRRAEATSGRPAEEGKR